MFQRSRLTVAVARKALLAKSYSQAAAAKKEKWDLWAGVLLERRPVITKELTPLEKKVQKLLDDIDFENSLKSDHEVRHEREVLQAEKLKKGTVDLDLDADTTKQTAQDLEDACADELAKFKLAPRTSDIQDFRSLERRLDESLVLLVQQTLGKEKALVLPQGKWTKGETLRQTAERALRESTGGKVFVTFYGNAPVGFYKYKYPKEARNEAVGAKVFFFRAGLKGHQKSEVDDKVKFEWRTKEELGAVLKGKYLKNVSELVL